MKTTVKEFILEHLTDQRFEQIVNQLIEHQIWYYLSDDEMSSLVKDYMTDKQAHYSESGTFKIMEEIRKVSTSVNSDYRDTVKSEELVDLSELSQFSMEWMPSEKTEVKHSLVSHTNSSQTRTVEIENEPPLDDEMELFPEHSCDKEGYDTIHQISCALIPNGGYIGYDDRLYELDQQNYKEIVDQFIPQTALALVNFIFETMHSSNPKPLASVLGDPSDGTSYVRVSERPDEENGYGIDLFLAHRSMYASEKARESHRRQIMDIMDTDAWYRPTEDVLKFPVKTSAFVDYDLLIEDLSLSPEYLVAPFTFYLNEDITLPNAEPRLIDDLLFQLIHVLTYQGFIKEEQVEAIKHANETYEQQATSY